MLRTVEEKKHYYAIQGEGSMKGGSQTGYPKASMRALKGMIPYAKL